MVAAAIVGAAVVGAAATSYSSNESSKATEGATNASIAYQEQTNATNNAMSKPYRDLGESAIGQYQSLLGLSGDSTSTQKALENTPGYQFTLNQGLTSTKNAATAQGMSLSGNTLEALDNYSSGLADSTYQNAVNNAYNAVNIGEAAAAGQATNNTTTANNVSSSTTSQGQTNASIYTNEAASLSSIINNAANSYGTYNTLKNLGTTSTGSNADYGP